MTDPGSGTGQVARFFGGLLMAVGVLIAVTSGLCSLGVTVTNIFSSSTALKIDLPLVLMFGGIPFAIGLGTFFGGRALYRSGAPVAGPPAG